VASVTATCKHDRGRVVYTPVIADNDTADQKKPADRLPPYAFPGRCDTCGATREIRVHFCRSCAMVPSLGDHFHRICPCGHEWAERCS
jgi:hypothetical protein